MTSSPKIETIISELKTITLLEAAELVKTIEETFGVDASVGSSMMVMGMATGTPPSTAEVAEEKTEFDLVLSEVPADKKIAILKVVRSITGLGLKEAKDLVESAPKTLQEALTKQAAETAQKQLEDAGAKVTLK
jgi:large subunit ribosomal protein L7/L12